MRLIAEAQVVVENFRPGAMTRLGLDYAAALKVNPGIVYCSLSAFGTDGPLKDKQGLDVVLQAMSGLMSITGEPEGGPLPAGAPIADISSGVFGALGVVMGVLQQRRSNAPQHVELAMLDCMITMLNLRFQQMFAEGANLSRMGAGHPQATPWDVYHASDAAFVIAATRDEYWVRMCETLGFPQHAADPRFATIKSRVANRVEVNRLLSELFRQRPRQHWLELLDQAQVPNGPVNSLMEVAGNHSGRSVMEVDHAGEHLNVVASPIVINGRRGERAGPPALGDHTDAVLHELGLRAAERTPEGVQT